MTQTTQQVSQLFHSYQTRIEEKLKLYLPNMDSTPKRLHQAMHYTVMSQGKRLRPLLVYATGASLGANLNILDTPAAAVELIHTYSLIHDDLPAMDNDDLRRGQPSCHKAFDEATAILVGDSLQSLAFELLANQNNFFNSTIQLQMIQTLANASGSYGMTGGQILDLQAEAQQIDMTQLEIIHKSKTGALIRASVKLGALAAGCEDHDSLYQLDQYAGHIGLAFQIQDDILDVEGNTQTLGKQSGADTTHQKATYPAITSLHDAKKRVALLNEQALDTLKTLSFETSLLEQLSHQLTHRNK